MTPGEYAALMGAPDFPIDGLKEHHAYSGFGDAVCAPVVEWLTTNYFIPHLSDIASTQIAAVSSYEQIQAS
jgi:DNA (cytosine-5)-methyltransferase 1